MPQCQFLFSDVFLFQIFTKGNILGIGRNKSQFSYFSDMKTESKGETDTSREAATPCHGAGPPSHASLWCGPLGHPPTSPFSPIYCPQCENPRSLSLHPQKVPQHRLHRRQVSGDRSLCSGTLPRRGITPGAISIDSTAIFITIADSHDEEGVGLPRC
jgi:hypothetical protein